MHTLSHATNGAGKRIPSGAEEADPFHHLLLYAMFPYRCGEGAA
jgi:hypothetical protein